MEGVLYHKWVVHKDWVIILVVQPSTTLKASFVFFRHRAPKSSLPASGPFKTDRGVLECTGVCYASNVHVEVGETMRQSM